MPASQALVQLNEGVPQLLQVVVFQLLCDESERHLDSPCLIRTFHHVDLNNLCNPWEISRTASISTYFSHFCPLKAPYSRFAHSEALPSSSASCSGSASASERDELTLKNIKKMPLKTLKFLEKTKNIIEKSLKVGPRK